MSPKLRSLLVAMGIALVGGTTFYIARPGAGVTRADLADAGIDQDCDPVQVECQVRDLCQSTLADGGLSRRYGTIRSLAYQCNRPGNTAPVLIQRWPRQGGADCYEPVGPPDTACQVIGATFDDGGTAVTGIVDRCACRARGQVCRSPNPDGGVGLLMNFDQTYPAPFAQYTGAGCTRKPCGEMAGEQGQSMPDECK